jgi:hypothetical protein
MTRETEVVKWLVAHWPEGMLEKDRSGNTALHSAAAMAEIEIVKLLVEYWPASRRACDFHGQIPLSVFAKWHAHTPGSKERQAIFALLGGVYCTT